MEEIGTLVSDVWLCSSYFMPMYFKEYSGAFHTSVTRNARSIEYKILTFV